MPSIPKGGPIVFTHVLSPGGSLLADSQVVQLNTLSILLVVGRGTGGSKSYKVYRIFFCENCLFDGTGGTDGLDGRKSNGSFNFFHFKIY